jgi:DNA-binding MarR family transcriptional regulator
MLGPVGLFPASTEEAGMDAAAGRAERLSPGDLADKLVGVSHQLRRASMRALAPLGLTPAQERALRLISRTPQPSRMGELAGRLGIVPRSATTLIGALEETGLVSRSIDPDNRRSILVTLTDQGRAVQQRMAAARAAAGAELFGRLSDAERVRLASLLDKVLPPAADG